MNNEPSYTSINEPSDANPLEINENEYNMLDWNDDSIVSNLKIMRQKALVKELQSKLTKDELEEEKK